MAGYSQRPLTRKLGIEPGDALYVENRPAHYADLLAPLPDGVVFASAARENLRFIHLFVTRREDLAEALPRTLAHLAPDGMIWVSWPKKAARVPTDVTEDVVRQLALPLGLVDVKVCAVDEVWSGLKLVIRRAKRSRPEK